MKREASSLISRQHRGHHGREGAWDDGHGGLGRLLRSSPTETLRESGVRLAQKMQVGPCIPVGFCLLGQLLGQLGAFLTLEKRPPKIFLSRRSSAVLRHQSTNSLNSTVPLPSVSIASICRAQSESLHISIVGSIPSVKYA